MKRNLKENGNETEVTEFILLGFSYNPHIKMVLFVALLVVYLVTLTANSLFIIVTLADSRLHSPMYFFLCNLALLDLCYSSVSGPIVLAGLFLHKITVSYSKCMTQMYLALSLGQTECFLLALMAWDRYVAICNPFHYQEMMNAQVCTKLAIITWASGFLISLSSLVVFSMRDFCGYNIIDHVSCEVEVLSRLTCKDTFYSDILATVLGFLSLVVPLSMILFTYLRIISTILQMPRADRSQRAFATCGSHLVVVSLFYGTAMGIYLTPKSTVSSAKHKSISVFYGLVVPALNPLIYTLRNKEVKGALTNLYNRGMLLRT